MSSQFLSELPDSSPHINEPAWLLLTKLLKRSFAQSGNTSDLLSFTSCSPTQKKTMQKTFFQDKMAKNKLLSQAMLESDIETDIESTLTSFSSDASMGKLKINFFLF